MKETIEEIVNISIGAASLIKDRIVREIDDYLEEKDLSEVDREEFKKRLVDKAEKERDRVKKLIGKQAEEKLEKMGFVREKQVRDLENRIKELEKKISELKGE